MNWLDALLLLPLLIGLVRGLMRGIITEVIAIVAVILGVVGARLWGLMFSNWLLVQFQWPDAVCRIVAYALLFLGIAIVLNIIGRLLSKLLRAIHLGFVNRLLGGVFGTMKWGIIVLAIVFCVHHLDRQFHFLNESEAVKSSSLYLPFAQTADMLYTLFPQIGAAIAEP